MSRLQNNALPCTILLNLAVARAEELTNSVDNAIPLSESRPPTSSSMWTSSFTYGLIVGQFSVLLVFILFIRFFIFADPPQHRKDYPSHVREQRQAKILPSSSGSVSSILEKTYYNVEAHPAESLDWFTVLIALAINQLRDDARRNDNILKSLDAVLNGDKIPDFIDAIKVTELNIGDDYPIFSNCRIVSTAIHDLEAQIDVDLTDTLTLGIETKVFLNFPKSLFAFLPASLSVSIVRFSGKLTVKIKNLPLEDSDSASRNKVDRNLHDVTGKPTRTYLILSFSSDYRLEFNVKSLVGARSRLQDVPKIGQLVESRLRKYFNDRMVAPHFLKLPLPTLWKPVVSESSPTNLVNLAPAVTPGPGSPVPKQTRTSTSTPRTTALEERPLRQR
jgi:maintenance of mitochondrial morphology protein 1